MHHLPIRNIPPQFLQPNRRFRITRRAPITARRKGTARANLWPIRNRSAFELTRLEKASQENLKPLLDRGEVILMTPVDRDQGRPGAAGFVAPRVLGKESNFAWAQAEAADVIK